MGFLFSKSDFSHQVKKIIPITFLLTLKDGRLAASSWYGKFNIYNETLSGIDLSINHEYSINYFIQLNNENLVICSNSNCSMEIIQLKNKNQYKIIQVIRIEEIIPHYGGGYFKVIETKDNELITIYNGLYIKKQIHIMEIK